MTFERSDICANDICANDICVKGTKLGEGKGNKLGEPCPKVRLSPDRLPIEPFAHMKS